MARTTSIYQHSMSTTIEMLDLSQYIVQRNITYYWCAQRECWLALPEQYQPIQSHQESNKHDTTFVKKSVKECRISQTKMKQKLSRQRLNKEQKLILDLEFMKCQFCKKERREKLSILLDLSEEKIKVKHTDKNIFHIT